MSQLGKFLNLHPHMESWAVYNVDGPYTTEHKIGTLAPAQFGGLSYMILDEKGGDVYIIQTESFGRCAIWAPQDNDSNITYERTYSNGDNHGSGGGSLQPVTGNGKFLNLKAHMQSWAVYNVDGPYTTEHKIGTLAPAQYGGLSYQILEEKGGDVYIIQTESFGRCAIWAPRDNDSSISSSPEFTNGGTSSSVSTGGSGTGRYLNLKAHMQSWAVYNVDGPYTTEHKIGTLAPAQYGGLSYQILEEKGGDVYIIQTESFGRCAIWAPRDNDSSISSSPEFTNGGTSSGGSTGGYTGTGGVEVPGGLKVFIDPGHGGNDPGATGNGLQEKNIVLSIAKKLGVILNSYGVSVKYSRENDTFVGLEERAQMANNWGASLFVSIHANSAATPVSGTECFTKSSASSNTKLLSASVANAISNRLGIPNRGHKEESWRVLVSSNMPSILVETAFINHAGDANLLLNRQDDFANAIATEILNYLNINSSRNKVLEQLNNIGFAKEFGVEFSTTDEEILIAQAGPIKISLEATSNDAFGDSPIVANIENGKLVGGTLKTDLMDLGIQLIDEFEISLEQLLLELGNDSISVATATTSTTISISFITTHSINDISSMKQILKIEFDKNKINSNPTAAAEELDSFLQKLSKIAQVIVIFACIIVAVILAVKFGIAAGITAFAAFFISIFTNYKNN